MERQPPPRESRCPDCGGEPTDESLTRHSLSANGYLHDDAKLECSECQNSWRVGRPIGEYDGGDDLWCDSCDSSWMFVHRVVGAVVENNEVQKYRLQMKCPNEECFHFKEILREPDERGVALVGYPPITGSMDGATGNYGYPPEKPPSEQDSSE